MGRAQDLADQWETWKSEKWDGTLSLSVGTVVRAKRDLDNIKDVGPIPMGTLGYVFGETNCYGDGNGPMVQWFTFERAALRSTSARLDPRVLFDDGMGEPQHVELEAKRVCNVYPGDVEVVRVHDTVDVRHVEED